MVCRIRLKGIQATQKTIKADNFMKFLHLYKQQIIPLFSCTLFLLVVAIPAQLIANANYEHRYQKDVNTILTSRDGMKSILAFIDENPEIFSNSKSSEPQQPNREQRVLIWQTWQSMLDHIFFFDTMGSMYGQIYKNSTGKIAKQKPFIAAFSCFLAQYRFAMEYIERMERNPDMHILLNDSVPEFGLDQGGYAKVKYRFLNVIRGAEFVRLNILYDFYKNGESTKLTGAIEEDRNAIWQMGKGQGPSLTAQNALKIVGDIGFTTWFPLQKNISQLMGEIKVWRPGISLISSAQIQELKKEMRPGDIMLQRREWYATNVGIPGFWTHAALYIGRPEERATYFSSSSVINWLKTQGSKDGSLDSLLKQSYPESFQKSLNPQEDGSIPRVIEAIADGVSFTTLEHSASADSLVVLRPKLPQKSIAQAIIKAFHYSGRPYDFNFDFRTDSELVCSELIYKAYEGSAESAGLSLPLAETLQRPLIAPNQIAQLFDEEYGREKQQFNFVVFLDGNEKKQKAFPADVEAFRQTWKRPKWHIWLQSP